MRHRVLYAKVGEMGEEVGLIPFYTDTPDGSFPSGAFLLIGLCGTCRGGVSPPANPLQIKKTCAFPYIGRGDPSPTETV